MLLKYTEDDIGRRIDVVVSEREGITRSAAARLIEEGFVTKRGGAIAKNYRLRAGDEIDIEFPEAAPSCVTAEEIPLDIIYEDDSIIVVNKPVGMVVHPAPGNYTGTLVNALLAHCRDSLSGIGGEQRPGIIHRIDKDTGGLLVVAKNDEAHLFLSEQIKMHRIERIYHAIATGNLKEDRGTINLPIGRHPVDRKRMAVIKDTTGGGVKARSAVTHYEVIERFGAFTYLRLRLETGRTHQIRVHLSSLGHPLVGDLVYGGGKTAFEKKHSRLLSGQCLYAKELHFLHPKTGEQLHFEGELPDNFTALLDLLRKTYQYGY
ncbi:MAG: RluA family pseudouridine synthase [Clostridiales bacterium]|nr:RluA family pseudouridine synthase [Clostridiales bacterium]